jgi:hypothetical protein
VLLKGCDHRKLSPRIYAEFSRPLAVAIPSDDGAQGSIHAYRKGDYHDALRIALKFNMPGHFYTHALTTAVYGQLGMREPAQKALQELLAIRPGFAVAAREEFEKSHDPELVAQLIDGLCKAGLEIPDKDQLNPTRRTKS